MVDYVVKYPSKVDNLDADALCHLAKRAVATGLANPYMIQLSYAIGVACPFLIHADAFWTVLAAKEQIEKASSRFLCQTPRGTSTNPSLNRSI